MANRTVFICGPTDCPNDPDFEHDNYFGCVPKDLSATTGRSKRFSQKKDATTNLYRWNGGCDTAPPRCPQCTARPHRGGQGSCECECHDL